jgi:hypothetical protein
VIGVEASAAHVLPCIETSDGHTADVVELNAGIELRYGIRVTVLRSLDHGQVHDGVVERSHEIEVHDGVDRCSLDWRESASLTLDAADRAVVAAWQEPLFRISRSDWMLPGWFDTACAWIVDALRTAGLAAPSSIRQIRTWASSCVLEIATPQSKHYFKALPESGRVEHAVTQFLGGHFPHSVPRLIAVDADRRWLLLDACAGRKLEVIDNIDRWARAARHYGELQVACMSRVCDLEHACCPRRELELLPAAVSGQLGERIPNLAERCAELRACGIPDSIEHGDLWPGNIFVDAHDSAIIDWEDVGIAHPFLSIAPLIVGLGHAGLASPENVERLEREYVSAFGSIAPPAELRRALSLVAPLSFLDIAVRYRKQRPSVVRLHPWMSDLVPQTIRLALARL